LNSNILRPQFTFEIPELPLYTFDVHILLTKYSSNDLHNNRLYELDPSTGTLTQRASIPGASLIIDGVAQ
jgi:hypothetical protein